MRARGIPRSEAMYTTLMSLCVRAERLHDSLAAFNELLDEGLEPSLVTLHTLMDTYGQLQQWSNALAVLDVITSKVHLHHCHCTALCKLATWNTPAPGSLMGLQS
jgi:pentatricopeptide repeat protein